MSKSMNSQYFLKFINRFGYQARRNVQYQYNTKTSNIKKKLESVVGLEIHVQLSSKSKLFSGSGTEFISPVNTSVSLFDSAIPGTLPVLNKSCVEMAVLTALTLSCEINPISMFDRKHYFYADLPAGYQITQHRAPLAVNGHLAFQVFTTGIHKTPYHKVSKIKQIQLEQDSGKSLHDENERKSLIDLNRAGIPLMELVFEPDLKDGEEAAALVKELILILNRIGSSSCKMEEGAIRVDANVSMHCQGEPLGTRTELKNLGSVRTVAHAIAAEIERQQNILENGGQIINETRAWDLDNKCTVSLRDKEEKQDYRFMPEPNLPPLKLLMDDNEENTSEKNNLINVNKLRKEIPELPEVTRQHFMGKYGLKPEFAIILVNEEYLGNYFKKLLEENPKRIPKQVANLLIMEFLSVLNTNKLTVETCSLPTSKFGELVDLFQNDKINLLVFKNILSILLERSDLSPSQIVRENKWEQITSVDELQPICEQVIKENPALIKKIKKGRTKAFVALTTLIVNKTESRANMKITVEILKKLLEK